MDRAAEDGFQEFVAGQWPGLVRTAYLITTDRGIAEDCVQDALSRLYGRWRKLQQDGNPAAYAHRSVVNAALSWRRRRRVAEVALSEQSEALWVTQDLGAAFDPVLLRALRSLPPRMRAVLVLRYLEDRSEAQTAADLGCSIGTVKSTSSRGVSRLRALLEAARTGEPE